MSLFGSDDYLGCVLTDPSGGCRLTSHLSIIPPAWNTLGSTELWSSNQRFPRRPAKLTATCWKMPLTWLRAQPPSATIYLHSRRSEKIGLG